MLWWMWLLLAFAIACVVALWLARGRNDHGDPLLLDRADRASSVDRYDWISSFRYRGFGPLSGRETRSSR